MKKTLLTLNLLALTISFGQYSNYYDVNVNSNSDVNVSGSIDINKNVNVSGNVNKTITTIDYGALRLANAQAEKNRLEAQMFANETAKKQALEIASNPVKAYDYGQDNYYQMDKKTAETYGFTKNSIFYHKAPNNALFNRFEGRTAGYNYRNESAKGVITEIELATPFYIFGTTQYLKGNKKDKQKIVNDWSESLKDNEKYVKDEVANVKVGELNEGFGFVHKIEIDKTNLFGIDAYMWTVFYENDYEFVIKNNYRLIMPNGVINFSGARFKGDKDDISFEDLEGRRSYFKRLLNKIFSTARVYKQKGDLLNK